MTQTPTNTHPGDRTQIPTGGTPHIPTGETPRAPTGETPEDTARNIVTRSGTSFYWAMRVLPEKKRNAIYGLYAFCRDVDDIADGDGAEADKRQALKDWRDEIEAVFAAAPSQPMGVGLHKIVTDFGLQKSDLISVIEGMETDAADRVRLSDGAALEQYCDRVACAVGRLSNRIFGVPEGADHRLAHALGQALQLTNILRDLSEDAARDRLYLPRSLLLDHGIEDTDPAAVLAHPNLGRVCQELAGVAQNHYAAAAAILADCDRPTVRPARIMMEMYRRLLDRLLDRGWGRIDERMRLSKWVRLWVVLRHGVF